MLALVFEGDWGGSFVAEAGARTMLRSLRARSARLSHAQPWIVRAIPHVGAAAAIVLWGSLALGLLQGRGRINAFTGTPFGEDLLSLHAAATIVRTGRVAHLYDDAVSRGVQAATLGPVGREVFNRFMSPPHTAALFVPASLIPFRLVVWLWAAAALAALFFVPRLVGARRPLWATALLLAFAPVCDGFLAGQNAIFTLFLFAASFFFWQRDRGYLAGVALGLVAVYKPHLVPGPALLYLLESRRDVRPIVGLGLVVIGLVAIDIVFFPDATRRFLAWGEDVTTGRAPLWDRLRPGGEMTVIGFLQNLRAPLVLSPRITLVATVVFSVAACAGFVVVHRRLRGSREGFGGPATPRDDRLVFALATLVTLWLTPHAHLYEWTLMALPALLVSVDHAGSRALLFAFVTLMLAVPFSVRIARAELAHFGTALHPAVPLLLWATVIVILIALGRLQTPESARRVGRQMRAQLALPTNRR